MPRVAGVTVGMRGEMARFQADMREGVGIVNRSVSQIKGSLNGLNTFIGTTLGASVLKQTVGEVVRVGDAYNQLLGRLKNATAATGDFNRVYQQLYQISQRNGAALEDSVSTFQGLARSAGELGATSGDIVRLTDIVQKLGRISGASNEAMKNGMLQFTQALAGGTVHAEEFNSILENMPAVADAVAKNMGKSIGQVRQMVKDQKLSSEEMYKALLKAGAEVDKQFSALPSSVAAATQKMSNAFGKTVHELDEVTGATRTVAAGINAIADAMVATSPTIVQWGRTLSAFMTTLKGEWENMALAAEMQQAGFTTSQQVKFIEARRKQIEKAALYQNYDFGRGPGENGIADVFGPNLPQKKIAKGPSEESLKQLEKEQKKVAEILADRVKERRELELKLKGFDDLRVKYEEEVAYIKSTTLSNKEKQAALKQLAEQYEAINQKTKFLKKQEEQKEAIKNAKELLEKAKQAREELEMELGSRAKLTKYLELELQYKKLLAEGNKGSAEAKKAQDDVKAEMERVKEAEAAVKAKEAYDKISDSTGDYSTNLQSITKNLQIQNDDLQLRLQGEEKVAQFIKAKQEIEEKTNEVLQKKYETLKQIQAIEAENPGNAEVAAYRAKVEKEITDAMAQRDQALASVEESKDAHERLNKALEQQEQILKDIIDSKGQYRDKVNALKDAMDRGYITTDQYTKALKQIGKVTSDATKLSTDLSKSITSTFEKMIFSGGKATDTLKQFGKEIAQLAARRLLLDPLQRKLESLFNAIGGGGTKVPMAPGGYGPLYGGSGIAGGGMAPLAQLPAFGLPYAGPSTVNFGNSPLGGLLSGAAGSGLIGGLPSTGGAAPGRGGLMDWLGSSGLKYGGMSLGDWMEQYQIGGTGWAKGGAFRHPLGAAGGLLGSLIGKLPFFATGGYLGAGQWGIAGENGPELIYGGGSGMSIMPPGKMGAGAFGGWSQPWQQQNVYAGGRGGYTGNGMISQYDYADTMAGLMQAKYDSGVRAFQNGDPNAPSWYQLQEILAAASRYKTTVANGGYTGQLFSRAQFEMNSASADFNEAAYQWGGNRANVYQYMNSSVLAQQHNPNAHMNAMSFGLVSSGMGQMSQGGNTADFDLPPGMRQASYSIGGGYQPIISTGAGGVITQWSPNAMGGFSGSNVNSMATAFNSLFNGGDLRSAHDFGSYLSPLISGSFLNSNGDANQILANYRAVQNYKSLTSGANGGKLISPTPFEWLPGYKPRDGSLMGWNKEGIMRGLDRMWESTKFDSNAYKGLQTKLAPDMVSGLRTGPGPTVSELMQGMAYMSLKNPTLAPDMVSGLLTGNGSHLTLSDMLRAQSNGYGGGGVVRPGANLAWMLAPAYDITVPPQLQGAMMGAKAGYDMVHGAMPWWTSTSGAAMHMAQMGLGGITDKNSIYSGMASIMSQPWANKSMPFASYPSAMKLFGYERGGKYKKGQPMVVGEGGMEIMIPETAGNVVSNSQLKQAAGSGAPKINIVNKLSEPITQAQATVDVNGIVNLVLSGVARNIRQGGDVATAIDDRTRGVT